jgi:hypothetical protein
MIEHLPALLYMLACALPVLAGWYWHEREMRKSDEPRSPPCAAQVPPSASVRFVSVHADGGCHLAETSAAETRGGRVQKARAA